MIGSLEVEAGNPAANLYRRLGFVIDAESARSGVHTTMRWLPQPVVWSAGR